MAIAIRAYQPEDVPALVEIWNEVVEHGIAFPQKAPLTNQIGAAFFAKQSCTAAAYDTETAEIVGMYILHPNNVGRCGHICNASYAVKTTYRGQKIGEQLVRHCLHQARQMGFRILQFNAVVKENYAARKLYEKLGFVTIGTIPEGFQKKDGTYSDIVLYYFPLQNEPTAEV
ncbi:MAG TPA: GNAT family N-acetyltransferase [Ruminococcus sp.]|nr:GNAT family N-acetyltransferase [Ruminococcus sp.]HCW12846.1 GNAT family N-acetyltransferase [Ruminococcus sp.]